MELRRTRCGPIPVPSFPDFDLVSDPPRGYWMLCSLICLPGCSPVVANCRPLPSFSKGATVAWGDETLHPKLHQGSVVSQLQPSTSSVVGELHNHETRPVIQSWSKNPSSLCKMSPVQFLPVSERLCGLGDVCKALRYALVKGRVLIIKTGRKF